MPSRCSHLNSVLTNRPNTDGCEECLAMGDTGFIFACAGPAAMSAAATIRRTGTPQSISARPQHPIMSPSSPGKTGVGATSTKLLWSLDDRRAVDICGTQVEPTRALALEPVAKRAVSRCLDRHHRLERRHLDAGCRGRLVDDLPIRVAFDGGTGGSSRQHSADVAGASGGRARRHHRSSAPPHRHPGLLDDRCRSAGNTDATWTYHCLGAARLCVRPWRGQRHDDAGLVRDRAGPCSHRRAAIGGRLEQHRHQRVACDRAGHCGRSRSRPSVPGWCSC